MTSDMTPPAAPEVAEPDEPAPLTLESLALLVLEMRAEMDDMQRMIRELENANADYFYGK